MDCSESLSLTQKRILLFIYFFGQLEPINCNYIDNNSFCPYNPLLSLVEDKCIQVKNELSVIK